VLGDFDFAKELSEGGSVAGAVFTGDSDLASTMLSHCLFSVVIYECCDDRRRKDTSVRINER
jgi:hypothetical protein